MRILQVIPYFSPQMGGVAEAVYQISSYLTKRGHHVTVLASDYAIHRASFPESNFQRVIIPSKLSKWGVYITPGMIAWLEKYMNGYDVIHLHEIRTFQNLLVRYYSKKFHKPYVISAHGTLPIIVPYKIFKKIYDSLWGKRLIQDSVCVHAVSPVEVEQYRAFQVPDEKIALIPNALNLEMFSKRPERGGFRNRIHQSPESKIVLYLGRLHKVKNIDVLVKAFARISNIRDKCLVIVGPDQGERRVLNELVEQSGIKEQVIFLPGLYLDEKLAALQDADVVVYPGSHEIFGLVSLEALACGTPVIISCGNGISTLIKETGSGYIFDADNISSLSETITMALENKKDAQHRVHNGQALIRANFSLEKVVSEYEALYLGVKQNRSSHTNTEYSREK